MPGDLGAAGDVDGDGRADLLTYVRASSGNEVAYYVAASRPRETTTTPPGTVPPDGVGRLEVFNCSVERRNLHIWVFDAATGAVVVSSDGVAPLYNSTGTCPASGEPWDFNPDDGRWYDMVVVDPLQIGCGGVNDPGVAGCRKQTLRLRGAEGGPTWQVVVPPA
ncbi:hypothetical protein BJF78_22475 [Pseudonocardia sp. CNS-139]|nr:hypothetical protein BJF78_22475 [Pseudonocardia sp. CNS-139]